MSSWVTRFRTWNRRQEERTHYMVLLAIVVGLLGGVGAVGFRHMLDVFERVIWGEGLLTLEWITGLPWWHVVLAPTLGGLVVGLLIHWGAREAKGHGVPEVIEAIALEGGRIRPRVVAVKTLASGVCLASGGSVGREGPIVQIGAALGSTIGQWLRLGPRRLRTIAGCGAAAGIAATFNAPIAGMLFVAEVLLRDLRFTSISPLVVASVVATAVSRELLDNVPAFIVPQYALVSPLELVAYAVLGLLTAVLGVLFVRALYGSEDLLERFRIHPGLLAALGGAAVGGLALLFPEVLGNGYTGIETALLETPAWTWLAALLLAKIAAVCLTLGTGGSGGVFAPSLFLGAMAGGLVDGAMYALFPGSVGPMGAYALVGMGAMVAATTHAPLTAIIILFELTNDYRIILPLMIACVLGTLLSSRMLGESIYTLKLSRRGTKLHAGRDANVLRNVQVRSVAQTEFSTLPAGEPLLELLSDIAHDDDHAYFVTNPDGRYVGILTMHEVRPILSDLDACKELVTAADLADPTCEPLGMDDTVDLALARMQGQHRDVWPLAESGELVGAVHMDDILACYRREVFKRDMAQGMADAFDRDEQALRTIGNYIITERDAPAAFTGRTLAELDLRARYQVTVLVVKRTEEGEENVFVPSHETRVEAGDRLLVMGRQEAIAQLPAR